MVLKEDVTSRFFRNSRKLLHLHCVQLLVSGARCLVPGARFQVTLMHVPGYFQEKKQCQDVGRVLSHQSLLFEAVHTCHDMSGIFRLLLKQEIFPIIFMLKRPTDSNHFTILCSRFEECLQSPDLLDSHMVLIS